jgi:hypothetical protein
MNDNDDYAPASALLQQLIADDTPLSADNVAEVIALSRDDDQSNRDWALLMLAQSDLDTPELRAALVAGLDDAHHEAMLEALIGVAMREPARALPRVAALLDGETIDSMTLEAAAYVADPSLVPALREIEEEMAADGDEELGDYLAEAIECCESGTPPEWRDAD